MSGNPSTTQRGGIESLANYNKYQFGYKWALERKHLQCSGIVHFAGRYIPIGLFSSILLHISLLVTSLCVTIISWVKYCDLGLSWWVYIVFTGFADKTTRTMVISQHMVYTLLL
jgi:hypothetical protein